MKPRENSPPAAATESGRAEAVPSQQTDPGLERALGLKEAVALNMIDMIGIGPFVVSPLVIRAMGGPQALVAWTAGAVLALLDGFIWSELGAALPRAGGSYVFLREAYGPGKWGRLMSFLFVWQTLIQAPLVIASGAIGFSQYASYLHPFSAYQQKAISGAVVLLLIALLYRRISTIGKISVLLWIGVIGTMIWLIAGGVTHFNAKMAFSFPPGAFHLSHLFFAGLGAAMVSTTYTYWGYYNICHLGGELARTGKEYSAGDFYFHCGHRDSVSGHADQHPGCGALAESAELTISGQHFCGDHFRPVCRARGYAAGSVDCVRFYFCRAAGIFPRALRRRAGRKFFFDFCASAPGEEIPSRVPAVFRRRGVPLQPAFQVVHGHCCHPRHAIARAIHRAVHRHHAFA